jgi:proline-specific peptidase
MQVSEGYVRFRGHRTWYRVVGDAGASRPPLLALHGGPGSTHHYFAPLEHLASDRAVVVYDQLGCGASDRPSDVEWTLGLFVDEVATVREQLGLGRIHLLGTSWGGMLALEYALTGAVGICSLVLSSTTASAQQWASEQMHLRAALPKAVVAALDRCERTGAYDDPQYAAAEAVLFDRHFYRGPKPRRELERMAAERGTDVYRAMWGPNEWTPTGCLKTWDVRGRLHELRLPTLVARGRYDMSTPALSQTLRDGIPGARLVEFDASSHTPVLEETDRYLDVVGAFLREHDPDRRATMPQ